MADQFRTIGLIGKQGDQAVTASLEALIEYLQKRDLEVLIDRDTLGDLVNQSLPLVNRHELGEKSDLAIIIGGDGTLLNAARSLADCDVPILGINLGRLGFLVDLSPEAMTVQLDEILNGNFHEESRFLLQSRIRRSGEEIESSDALNDVVVHKWDASRMIECETYIDGKFLHSMRSDGIVVATPTGSTAYALSGGGPIMHPSLDAIVLVPICPHTLTNRPIVVDASSKIEIVVYDQSNANAQVTCDGQIDLGLVHGDRVLVSQKPQRARIIHPPGYDYYNILRSKLHWGRTSTSGD